MNDQPAGDLTEQMETILGTAASDDIERAMHLVDELISEYGYSSVVEAMISVASSSAAQRHQKLHGNA